MPNCDAIIVGTGQSGPALAHWLVAAGRKELRDVAQSGWAADKVEASVAGRFKLFASARS